jgi:hypothetical protein
MSLCCFYKRKHPASAIPRLQSFNNYLRESCFSDECHELFSQEKLFSGVRLLAMRNTLVASPRGEPQCQDTRWRFEFICDNKAAFRFQNPQCFSKKFSGWKAMKGGRTRHNIELIFTEWQVICRCDSPVCAKGKTCRLSTQSCLVDKSRISVDANDFSSGSCPR